MSFIRNTTFHIVDTLEEWNTIMNQINSLMGETYMDEPLYNQTENKYAIILKERFKEYIVPVIGLDNWNNSVKIVKHDPKWFDVR